jgi:hypothetical protein
MYVKLMYAARTRFSQLIYSCLLNNETRRGFSISMPQQFVQYKLTKPPLLSTEVVSPQNISLVLFDIQERKSKILLLYAPAHKMPFL